MSLHGLGLDPDEAAAYAWLVGVPSASEAEVGAALALDRQALARVLRGLEGHGLVARSGADPSHWVASPPTVAVGALLATRHQQLREAEDDLLRLAEVYRGSARTRAVSDVVDVVVGAPAVAQRFHQLQRGAGHEVLACVRAGVLVVSNAENVEEAEAVARGVSYRIVIERAVAERAGFAAEAEDAMGRGEQLRVVRSLPSRLLVVDRQLALMPMRPDEDGEVGALLVHASPLLDLVVAWFEATWAAAAPMRPAADAASGLEPLDRRVLTLLGAGLTDRAVATQLGLSMRTVQRRVRLLMDLADVDTRYQLGVEAVRRGWAPRVS